ncbi:hypothetical protein GCM10010423_58930 [Streptomyces levis]|uniref:Uncharacterized protein n=1 Tax=Streptomyces levis TaxID=285566 RepID=A0ABN3NZ88_9ACTN
MLTVWAADRSADGTGAAAAGAAAPPATTMAAAAAVMSLVNEREVLRRIMLFSLFNNMCRVPRQ